MRDLIKQILREEKKKLFVPRGIDERSVEFGKMVKDGSDKFLISNDIKSLKYRIDIEGSLWDDLDYSFISDGIDDYGEIILNDGEKLNIKKMFYKISHSDFIDYSHIISSYLSYLISQHNPKDFLVEDLEINVESVVGNIKIDFIFTLYDINGINGDFQNKSDMIKVVRFSKTI